MNANVYGRFFGCVLVGLLAVCSLRSQIRTQAVCTGDTVVITLGSYKGTVKWQQASNLTSWTDIAGANAATLRAVMGANTYYRAAVQEATGCPTFYSDTTLLSAWNPALAVNNVKTQTVGTSSFSSSSKLVVSWKAPAFAVSKYEITATESVKNTSVVITLASSKTSDTLKGLKSGTNYKVSIKACTDDGCKTAAVCGATSSGSTSQEYWQLQGTGNTVAGLKKVVADGNTLNYAFVYGSWAPHDSLKGRIRYYYNPLAFGEKGTKSALSNAVPRTGDIASAITFTGLTGYGLTYSGYDSTVAGTRAFRYIGQAQAVPYQGKVRMYFEAQTADNRTRIHFIDSKDGLTGIDYNAGTSTLCKTTDDFKIGGGCDYTTALSVGTDATNTNPNISDIRQFKIGYPTLDSWLWNGAAGTFMTPTFDVAKTADCGNKYSFTTGYALWDGSAWKLQYNGSCPKFFDGVQAPCVVHLGGSRYKFYFNYNQVLKGQTMNPQRDTKPMRVMYAEGTSGVVQFEDWEGVEKSRDMVYLFPDGTALTELQESKLDDYHFFAPTGDMEFQVQYSNISDGTSIPFVAAAVLLNP